MKPQSRWSPLSLWLIAAVSFLVTLGVGILVVGSSSMAAADIHAVIVVNGVHSSMLDTIAQSIDIALGPRFAVVVAVIGIGVAWVASRSWRAALRMGLLIVAPWAAADAVKVIVQRPRLDMSILSHAILLEPPSFSYPSGHTAFAAALGMGAVILCARWRYRSVVLAIAIVIAVVTAWSRIYLGAHYPSDVLASLILVPVLSLCLSALMNRTRLAPSLPPRDEPDRPPLRRGSVEDVR